MTRIFLQDSRTMGVNNLNQLTYQHLGSNSFNVVAEVHANLHWLNLICKNLSTLQSLAANNTALTRIGQNIHALYAIAESMPALNEVYHNLDSIKGSAQYYCSLVQDIKALDEKLGVLMGIISQEGIDMLLDLSLIHI